MKGNISTKQGDRGKTAIIGGERVDKDDPRIECLGALDEATAMIGLLRSKLDSSHPWESGLKRIQIEMMNLMSHAATPSSYEPKPRTPLPIKGAEWLEEWMDAIEQSLPSHTEDFLLPGGSERSALCHMCRVMVRRAERRLAAIHKIDPVDPSILEFINRLSDLFFKLSRQGLHDDGIDEDRWRLFVDKGL